ncbi:MAG: tetratricopeptide repeat protein [Phycisphaerales bacterium]|nr:tetratricopeptide repeat protein [Phycisphaerales bacterium]
MRGQKLSAKATSLNTHEFLTTLQPSLVEGKLEEALDFVRKRWTAPQIVELLRNRSPDVRKVAALALALVGDRSAVEPLAVALHDRDAMVWQMAEYAMWTLWFRLGKQRAIHLVKCGNSHMHHNNYDCAIEKFSQAIDEDPDFAEAYHQRAISYYLIEQFTQSITDCKAALARMPQHFGAMAAMGHCRAHLGQWPKVRRCYRLALAIHPGLDGLDLSLRQIDQLLRRSRKPEEIRNSNDE